MRSLQVNFDDKKFKTVEKTEYMGTTQTAIESKVFLKNGNGDYSTTAKKISTTGHRASIQVKFTCPNGWYILRRNIGSKKRLKVDWTLYDNNGDVMMNDVL